MAGCLVYFCDYVQLGKRQIETLLKRLGAELVRASLPRLHTSQQALLKYSGSLSLPGCLAASVLSLVWV